MTPLGLSRSVSRPSWRVQADALGALVMREIITRYGRHNLGFLWLFVEPMLFTLGIATLWSVLGHIRPTGFTVVEFAVTGYSSVLLWRNCANRCVQAVEPNLSLLYHRNVRLLDIFMARALLEVAAASASFLLLTVVFVALGMMQWPRDLLQVLGGWVLLAWFGMGLGTLLGALAACWEVLERFWHPMAYLLFPLSGAMYLVDWLPAQGMALAPLMPMVNALEMLRGGWFGELVRVHWDFGYGVVANLVLSVLALLAARHAARKVQPA